MENAKKKEAESSGRDVFLAVNRNRQLTYSFLSRIYEKEMTVELLKEMREKGSLVLNGGSLPWVPDKELGRGWRILGEYMNGLKGNNLEQARLELAVDYASLFLGVKGKVWHPSESAYRSKGHLVMQEPMEKVLQAYWNAGVDQEKKFTEPPDHIAVELQFMSYLCRKTSEALERDTRDEAEAYACKQEDFLKGHLSGWIAPFTNDVLKVADTGFYRGAAMVTRRFVELDCIMVSDMLLQLKELEAPASHADTAAGFQ